MALQQAITQSSGYDANYWRLTHIDIDWENGRANLILKGYKDEQSRQERPQQGVMDTIRYNIRGDYFDTFFDVPDLSQIQEWADDQEYSTGELVQTGSGVWEASGNVSAGEAAPPENNSWLLDTDLRINRALAYEYVKQSADEFEGAQNV